MDRPVDGWADLAVRDAINLLPATSMPVWGGRLRSVGRFTSSDRPSSSAHTGFYQHRGGIHAKTRQGLQQEFDRRLFADNGTDVNLGEANRQTNPVQRGIRRLVDGFDKMLTSVGDRIRRRF